MFETALNRYAGVGVGLEVNGDSKDRRTRAARARHCPVRAIEVGSVSWNQLVAACGPACVFSGIRVAGVMTCQVVLVYTISAITLREGAVLPSGSPLLLRLRFAFHKQIRRFAIFCYFVLCCCF